MTNLFYSRFILLAVSVILLSANTAFAASGDDEVLSARNAYDKKDAIALSEHVRSLQNQGHILSSYADYWMMLLYLEDADPQTVSAFMNRYAGYPFVERLRGEYLKKLGKQQDWDAFLAEYANYHSEDAAVACYAAEANSVKVGIAALESAKTLWMQAKEQPGNCTSLYDRMQATGALTENDIWARLRLALAENRLSLAKSIVKRSASYEPLQLRLIDNASSSPTLVINKKSISFKSRFGREVNLYALNRIAKTSSLQALSAFKRVEDLFQEEDKAYFYGRLALEAAKRHEADALTWFKEAESAGLNQEQMDWYARAALRQMNWPELLNIIAKMEPKQADDARWRYWRARALNSQQQPLEANPILAKLSTERHYYGWLAQDELDGFISASPLYYKVTNEEVDAIRQMSAFQRIEALQRVDLRWEAKAEWAVATKDFDDKQLLAAAAFALDKQWHDLTIVTADKTTEIHDFSLRYPTPYNTLMKSAANEQAIDEAWVYGITRQESRFMHYAKSGVGASGLMQLMPATAKWAARHAGISNYNNSMIHELDTNVALGTYYLKHTLDLMDGQVVMATAAYNAGPSRAKKWAADTALEGTIYAETIPFSETRTYVQRVMANVHLYSQRLGLKPMTLKQRMGIVPGKAVALNVASETNALVEYSQPDE